MMDVHGDAAVESFAKSNGNRITILNKSGVFLSRDDKKRKNPIRNPKMRVGRGAGGGGNQPQYNSNQASYDYYGHQAQSPYMAAPVMPAAPGYDPNQPSYDYYGQPTATTQYSQDPYQYAAQIVQQVQQNVPQPVQQYQTGPPPPPQMAAYGNVGGPPAMHAQPLQAPGPGVAVRGVPAAPASAAQQQAYPRPSSTKVFLENLPLTATQDDICNCLFQYSLRVNLCTMEWDSDPKASWCYAHIEFASPEEATRCIALAQQSLLEYRGRILTASDDSNYQPPPGAVPPPGAAAAAPYAPAPGGAIPPSNYAPAAMPGSAGGGGIPPPGGAGPPQPQYDQYGPPMNYANQPPPPRGNHNYPPPMNNSRNNHSDNRSNNNGGRGGGRGRGGQNRSNRRHRPY